jgi:hypothetical protein
MFKGAFGSILSHSRDAITLLSNLLVVRSFIPAPLLAFLWQAKRRGNRIALIPSPVLKSRDMRRRSQLSNLGPEVGELPEGEGLGGVLIRQVVVKQFRGNLSVHGFLVDWSCR